MNKKNPDCLEKTLGRNMNITGASGELPDRSEGCVAACGEKGHPHYTVVGNGVNRALLDGHQLRRP